MRTPRLCDVGVRVASSAEAPVARGAREEFEKQLFEAAKPEEELSNLMQRHNVRAAMDVASASAAGAEEMAIVPRKGRGFRVQDDDEEHETHPGAGSGPFAGHPPQWQHDQRGPWSHGAGPSSGGNCRSDTWCHRICDAVFSSLGHVVRRELECEQRCERRWSYRGGMEDVMGGYRKHGTC